MAPPPVHTWQANDRVGRFSLVRELARGGMGVIWLARDPAGRELVLKRLLTSSEDVESVKMFLDEARIAALVHHPNVIEVFELGEDPGSVYLVMEYVRGQTVSALMKRVVASGGRLPDTLAVTIALGAARGLGSAHRCTSPDGKPLGIVHRDVSPQNVLVTHDGGVKVFDFGIARAEGRLVKTATGIVKGKVAYMSPEQASGGVLPVTSATDVYALGLVLFEMLTGTRYWNTRDEMTILRRLVLQPQPELPSLRAPVDPELEVLVLRALATDAGERFVDGQTFAEALEGWLRTHPPTPGTPTLSELMAQTFAGDLGPDSGPLLATPNKVSVITEQVSPAPLPRSLRPTLVHSDGEPQQRPTILVPPSAAPPPPSRSSGLVVVIGGLVVLAVGGLGFVLGGRQAERRVEPPAVVVAPAAVVVDAGPPAVEELDPIEVARATPLDDTPEPPERPSAAAPASVTGKLSLDTNPWTTVFLGKRSLGDTPLIEVSLPAGTHTLRLVNQGERIDRRVEVVVKPRQTTVKKLSF